MLGTVCKSSQKNCSRGTTLGGQPEESTKMEWCHFILAELHGALVRTSEQCIVILPVRIISADLVHADALQVHLHLNQPRGCLHAPLWCARLRLFHHRSHYTPGRRQSFWFEFPWRNITIWMRSIAQGQNAVDYPARWSERRWKRRDRELWRLSCALLGIK